MATGPALLLKSTAGHTGHHAGTRQATSTIGDQRVPLHPGIRGQGHTRGVREAMVTQVSGQGQTKGKRGHGLPGVKEVTVTQGLQGQGIPGVREVKISMGSESHSLLGLSPRGCG